MRNLHSTITRLKAMRERFGGSDEVGDDHLTILTSFGSNPGALQAKTYVPKSLRPGAPLVVVLHGCTQSAAGYDRSAAWSKAADEYGFVLLFPEQQRANNPNLCFNWFAPDDATRGRGEAMSIRQMVAAVHERHCTDPGRVFVTGLSAGGAMALVMLATYPEIFAGGAIIAGLPFGTARSVPQAFDRMRGHGEVTPHALAALVRSASTHSGPWPILSVWHGASDATVDPSNGRAIVEQWRALHRVPREPSRADAVNGYPHRVWKNTEGREVIEEYVITGMSHGTPLNAGEGSAEVAGPFMLDVGLSSTRAIASFWGIDEQLPAVEMPVNRPAPKIDQLAPRPRRSESIATSNPVGVQKTIEDALRAAGLMR